MSELLKPCRNPLISHTCLFSFLFLREKKMEAIAEFTPQAAFVTYALTFTNGYIHVLGVYVSPSLCALETVYSCLLKNVPPTILLYLLCILLESFIFLTGIFACKFFANIHSAYVQNAALLTRTTASPLVQVPSWLGD